jgi:hypothetical protein
MLSTIHWNNIPNTSRLLGTHQQSFEIVPKIQNNTMSSFLSFFKKNLPESLKQLQRVLVHPNQEDHLRNSPPVSVGVKNRKTNQRGAYNDIFVIKICMCKCLPEPTAENNQDIHSGSY